MDGLNGSYHIAQRAIDAQRNNVVTPPITSWYEQPDPIVETPVVLTPEQQFQANDKDGDGYVSDVENTSGMTVIETVVTPANQMSSSNKIVEFVSNVWTNYKVYILGVGAIALYWFVVRPMIKTGAKKLKRKFKKLGN